VEEKWRRSGFLTRYERKCVSLLCCTYLLCMRSDPAVCVYVCVCVCLCVCVCVCRGKVGLESVYGMVWKWVSKIAWIHIKSYISAVRSVCTVPGLRAPLPVATVPPRHAAVGCHCYCHQFLRIHTFLSLRLLM